MNVPKQNYNFDKKILGIKYEPYWLKQTGFMFWINWFIYHIWLKKLFIYESGIATSLMNMSRRDYHYELKKTNLIKCQIVFFGSAWQPYFFFIHIEKSSQDILKKQVRFSKNYRICGLTSIMFTNLMRRSLSDGLHKHISALRPVPACPLSLGPESDVPTVCPTRQHVLAAASSQTRGGQGHVQ